MTRKTIDYGSLMHKAMRGLIRDVLLQVSREGLPDEHHFFITFDTTHPDTEIADWLSDRYPTEMTVVMQHWFDKLDVTDDGFAVTLNFGEVPEALYIPYDAIKTFVDPSVEFGLRFESQTEERTEAETVPLPVEKAKPSLVGAESDKKQKDAEVVSLDKFRK